MINERDRLIERYLSGEMSPREEEDFHRRLATDERLRTMLRTEKLIRGTMARDRSTIPADHARTRSRALSLVAATPLAEGTGMAAGAGAGAGARAGAGAGTNGISRGLGGFKGIIGVMAGVAIVTGSFFLLESPEPSARHAPERSPKEGSPKQEVRTVPQPLPMPPTAPGQKQPETAVQEHPSPAARLQSTPREPRQTARREHSRPELREPAETRQPASSDQPPATLQQPEKPSVVLRNDTLRTKVKIETLRRD